MPSLESGRDFGPYAIEGFIARGGMGEVYAARHAVYGSPVALKVLHPHLHSEESWRKRFSEEGLVGQQLKHPHVLACRELVEHGGRVALVLDLCKGSQTLQQVMDREFPSGLPLIASIRTFLGLLQGVEYAHGKGVVHGDIKPENILIQGDFRDPTSWVPLVTDFGTVGIIAHPVMINGQPAVVASPRYASPEHLLGVLHVEFRSDVYCLGMVLHYLLTGHHASSARSVDEAAALVRHPVPVLNLVDQPEAVLAVFQRATHPDVRARFPSCREFALALREVLEAAGGGLKLEDLTADLATEVMEERKRLKSKARVDMSQETPRDNPRPVVDTMVETELIDRSEYEPGPIAAVEPAAASEPPEQVEPETPVPRRAPPPPVPVWVWAIVLAVGALLLLLVVVNLVTVWLL